MNFSYLATIILTPNQNIHCYALNTGSVLLYNYRRVVLVYATEVPQIRYCMTQ